MIRETVSQNAVGGFQSVANPQQYNDLITRLLQGPSKHTQATRLPDGQVRVAETYNLQGELTDFPLGLRFFEPYTVDPMNSQMFYEIIETNGGIALLRATIGGMEGYSYLGRVIPYSATPDLSLCEIACPSGRRVGTYIPGQVLIVPKSEQ